MGEWNKLWNFNKQYKVELHVKGMKFFTQIFQAIKVTPLKFWLHILLTD